VIEEIDSYHLESAGGFCPTSDKIDLDSGQPGYGGQPQLGDVLDECRTEGGLAELILEEAELHSPNNSQVFVQLDRGTPAGYQQCRAALDGQPDVRSRLPLASLAVDDQVCVLTDRRNIVLVNIKDIDAGLAGSSVTIAYIMWRSSS